LRPQRTLRLCQSLKGVDCQNQLEDGEAYEDAPLPASLQNYARLIFLQSFFRTWKGRDEPETVVPLARARQDLELIRTVDGGDPQEQGGQAQRVKLQEAENQIVVDYVVYARRPNDADLLIPAIETHRAKLRRTPYPVASDAAYYSAKNEAAVAGAIQ
jgi:transposase, IS5 family